MSHESKGVHVRVSVRDSDGGSEPEIAAPRPMDWERSDFVYNKQIIITPNVYNAYLLSKYRYDNTPKWKQAPWSVKIYLTTLTFFIAAVQWAAISVLIIAEYYNSSHKQYNFFSGWSILPDQHWKIKVTIWPLFFIGLCYTNARFIACELDLSALKNENIVVLHYKSGTDGYCRFNMELFILKHFTEGFLSLLGALVYYSVLAGCTRFEDWGDFMSIIFPMISYEFVYQLDEYAYRLVKDLFIVQFARSASDERDRNETQTPVFRGQATYGIRGMKHAPLRLLSAFFGSLYILGIFLKSYLVMTLFVTLWAFTSCTQFAMGKYVLDLLVKSDNN